MKIARFRTCEGTVHVGKIEVVSVNVERIGTLTNTVRKNFCASTA